MSSIIKWSFRSIVAVVVILVAVGLYNREKIIRLYHVNTLFEEEKVVSNFIHINKVFHTVSIVNTSTPFVWPQNPTPIATQYKFDGEMKQVADFLEFSDTTSMIVIKDGAVVSEEYYLGTGPADTRISWSVAKSFLSALYGSALERGDIRSLDDLVVDYVPELKGSAYETATIRNVMHMSSGVQFNEDYLDKSSDINKMGRVLALGGSMDEFAASITETIGEPGTVRQYTSIDTHVLSMVLRAATGKNLADMVGEELVSKLGFQDEAYYLTDSYGVAFALGGLNMSTRDYAKLGQMFLDYGMWQGEQVVPREWAIESVRDTAPASKSMFPTGYGYQWWVPDGANDEFFAIGIYGQYIYVNRPAGVVIAKNSAHLGFRSDGVSGAKINLENIEMFRTIAAGLN